MAGYSATPLLKKLSSPKGIPLGELNPRDFSHTPLKRARLPVPPRELIFSDWSFQGRLNILYQLQTLNIFHIYVPLSGF